MIIIRAENVKSLCMKMVNSNEIKLSNINRPSRKHQATKDKKKWRSKKFSAQALKYIKYSRYKSIRNEL